MKWVGALLLLILFHGAASALDPTKAVTQYGHDLWQVEEGLPNSAVYAIAQSTSGYLWAGTQGGLARFDGARFTIFDKGNTPAITDFIWSIKPDRDGSLWVGTFGGLVHVRDRKFTLYTTADGLVHNHILALCVDHQGSVWIGTAQGLSRFRGGSFKNYTTTDGLSSNAVVALAEDSKNQLWIGTSNGLNLFQNGKFTAYGTRDGLVDNTIISLFASRDGTLWIGTSGGLSRWRDGAFASFTTKDGLANNVVDCLLEDKDGNLWIGTFGGGVSRLNASGFTTYTVKDGLSAKIVRSFFEDREGNLWAGTDAGLERFKDTKFTTISSQEGLPDDVVHCVIEDRKGTVWVGTENGLCRIDHGKVTPFTSLQGYPVYSLALAGQDELWIGMQDGGAGLLKGGKLTKFSVKDGLLSESIFSIFEDRRGNVFLGPFRGGLNLYDSGKFRTLKSTADVPKSANSLFEDHAGTLWVGTNSGGLVAFDAGGARRVYTMKDGLSSDTIYALHEAPEGSLWIGTAGGLTLLRNKRFVNFGQREGLPDSVIYTLLEDDHQNFWMGCNKGVFRVSRTQLLAYADGQARSFDIALFGKEDGMKTRECAGGTQSAAWKARDGKLWFSTTKGVVQIDPEHLLTNRMIPPVVLEDVLSDDQLANRLHDNLILPPGKGNLEFHYTALCLTDAKKVRFKYRLDGFDGDWVDAGGRRTAFYTKIPPGKYRFRVIAANNDGIWNTSGDGIAIDLRPHFYQTLFFYGLCGLALGLIGWSLYRYRVMQLRARFQAVLEERMRISRELHDSVNQGLTGVSVQLEAILQSPQSSSISKHLQNAAHMVRATLAESRRLIQDLRPAALAHSGLDRALTEMIHQLSGTTSIQTSVSVQGTARPLPEPVANHLFRIAQEATSNAMKHSGAKTLSLELIYEAEQIRMIVRDDGKGFDPERQPPTGHFGLIGMRERIESLGGSLQIGSKPDEGTRIEVSLHDKNMNG